MAVSEAKLLEPPTLTWDEEFHRTYKSVYQVVGEVNDGPVEVANAAGIPPYGSSFAYGNETDLWAFCKSVDVKFVSRIKDAGTPKIVWHLTTSHTSKPSNHDPSKPRDNPLDEPPVIGGSFVEYSKPAWRDKDGNPIINTAKAAQVPPVEIEDSYDTLTIEYNTPTINLPLRGGYRNSVNSAPIWGLGIRQVKIAKWDWSIKHAGKKLTYVRNSFEFNISYKLHPDNFVCEGETDAVGWYTTLPNSGEYYYPGGWAEGNTIKDDAQKFIEKTDHPVDVGNLTCDGDDATGDDQRWNVWKILPEKDFTKIPGMPNPLPGPFA